jgi:hypothetical protein
MNESSLLKTFTYSNDKLRNLSRPRANITVIIKCTIILWAIEDLYIIKFELPRLIHLKYASISAVGAFSHIPHLSLTPQ